MRPEYKRVESDKEDWVFQVGPEHLGVGDTALTGSARTQAGCSPPEGCEGVVGRCGHAEARLLFNEAHLPSSLPSLPNPRLSEAPVTARSPLSCLECSNRAG